jgi:hypothetical protein
MDMNFPHPRHAAQAGQRKPDYSALIASASHRQAMSPTVRALLRGPGEQTSGMDVLSSRICFFGAGGADVTEPARGSFLPDFTEQLAAPAAKFESAINLAGSTYGKDDALNLAQPELQVAERGTEF